MEKKRKEVIELEPSKKQKTCIPGECMLVCDDRERITIDKETIPIAAVLKRHRPWEPGQLGVAQLPLGDFIFVQEEEKIRAIFERKTIADFIASAGDKRLEEQKTRLIQAKIDAPSTIVGLILEGSIEETNLGQYNAQHIQNTIWELSKFNLQVTTTKHLQETCTYLCYLRWSFSHDNSMQEAQDVQILSMAAYATKKKGMEPKDTYPKMLKSIPGVSAVHVSAIIEEFPSIMQYMNAFEDNPTLFDGFHLTEKRKMGKVLSEKMHKYTFNPEEE
jgi:ERCC4-type nuclease